MHEKSFSARRAISSVGERFLHTEEVAGSKPASPTILINTIHYLPKFGEQAPPISYDSLFTSVVGGEICPEDVAKCPKKDPLKTPRCRGKADPETSRFRYPYLQYYEFLKYVFSVNRFCDKLREGVK